MKAGDFGYGEKMKDFPHRMTVEEARSVVDIAAELRIHGITNLWRRPKGGITELRNHGQMLRKELRSYGITNLRSYELTDLRFQARKSCH